MQDILELFSAPEAVDMLSLGVDLVLSAIAAEFIYFVFVRFAATLSNRRAFGRIFLMVAVCTTLIIAVIKSSIALSLGLVGALSVIRFRAAVKEPEELAYLFLCIASGLGFGAGLRVMTMSSVLLILAIVALRGIFQRKPTEGAFNFSVNSQVLELEQIIRILDPFCSSVKLRRTDNSSNLTSSMFSVEFKSLRKLESAMDELKSKDGQAVLSFISNETLM